MSLGSMNVTLQTTSDTPDCFDMITWTMFASKVVFLLLSLSKASFFFVADTIEISNLDLIRDIAGIIELEEVLFIMK